MTKRTKGSSPYREDAAQPLRVSLPANPRTGEPGLSALFYRDRYRTIRISVCPDQTVIVKAPWHVRHNEITRILTAKRGWIESKLDMFRSFPGCAQHAYLDGEEFFYLGKSYGLRLLETSPQPGKRLPTARLWGAALEVAGSGLTHERTAKAIAAWRRKTSLRLLQKRVKRLHSYSCVALGDNIPLPSVKLRAFTRRWGSCSLKGEITLALSLSALPLPLVDYVILHELCHLRRFDHSKAFHSLVQLLVPDCRNRERAIKRYRLDAVRD